VFSNMKGFHILVITYILVINDKTCPRGARAGHQGAEPPADVGGEAARVTRFI
jgi:hypothetical protein